MKCRYKAAPSQEGNRTLVGRFDQLVMVVHVHHLNMLNTLKSSKALPTQVLARLEFVYPGLEPGRIKFEGTGHKQS